MPSCLFCNDVSIGHGVIQPQPGNYFAYPSRTAWRQASLYTGVLFTVLILRSGIRSILRRKRDGNTPHPAVVASPVLSNGTSTVLFVTIGCTICTLSPGGGGGQLPGHRSGTARTSKGDRTPSHTEQRQHRLTKDIFLYCIQ